MRRKRLNRPTAHYQVYMLVLARVTQLLQTTLQTFIHRRFNTHTTGPRMSKLNAAACRNRRFNLCPLAVSCLSPTVTVAIVKGNRMTRICVWRTRDSDEYALLPGYTAPVVAKWLALFHFKACLTVCLPDSHARYVRRFAEYFSVTALERSFYMRLPLTAHQRRNLFILFT